MAKLIQKTFKEALEGSGGNQSIIAKKLGKSRSTITKFLNKNPKMKDLLEIESERIIDVAENIIDHDITKNRNIDSSKWKLLNSKRGKARGYGPKQELEHSGGSTTFNLIEKSIEEIKNAKAKNKGSQKPDNKSKTSGNSENP